MTCVLSGVHNAEDPLRVYVEYSIAAGPATTLRHRTEHRALRIWEGCSSISCSVGDRTGSCRPMRLYELPVGYLENGYIQ